MAEVTLNQLITINDRNLQDVDIADFLDSSPFMRTNAATVASHDTLHKFLRYDAPLVGFRSANAGRENTQSKDKWTQLALEILDGSFMVDQAIAESYRLGGAAGLVNREAGRSLAAMMYKSELQVFNGTPTSSQASNPNPSTGFDDAYLGAVGTGLGDASGFVGLPNYLATGSVAGGMVVDAGGSAADSQTSVWIVRSGAQDVEIVTGRSGNISIGETSVQQHVDSGADTYPVLYTPVSAWFGLKQGSTVSSCARIANVDVSLSTGDGVLTDDLIYSALAMFGAGREPTAIYMSRAAREQLRATRTATNISGSPAPNPDSVGGVQIIVTDGILNSEPVLA